MKPETLEEMFRPQFAKPDAKDGFGLGFTIDELDGKKRIGHGGAIYGFATDLAALPDEKLGRGRGLLPRRGQRRRQPDRRTTRCG